MRKKTELTARGRMVVVLASLSLCGAWITRDENACLAAAMLIAPILIDRLWRGRTFPPLLAEVAARRTQADSPFVDTVRLHNPGKHTLHDLRIVEPRRAARASAGSIDTLAPGGVAELSLPSRCPQRGHFKQRVFACETTYPLGLLVERAHLTCRADLVVEPARVDLPAGLRRSVTDPESSAEIANRGAGVFWALREHRYGEDARRVHALRSAAIGSLVATVTRGEQRHDHCLVLDLRRPPGRAAWHGNAGFEWGLSAAATLVDRARQMATPLLCLVVAEQPRTFVVDDRHSATSFLTFLAEATPSRHVAVSPELQRLLEHQHGGWWIAAGGFVSRHERSSTPRLLVALDRAEPG